MTQNSNFSRILRAAAFSVVAIGSMAAGLSATTYGIAKANDYFVQWSGIGTPMIQAPVQCNAE